MFFNTIPQEGVFTNTTKQMLNIGNVLFKHAVITRVIILGFLFQRVMCPLTTAFESIVSDRHN